MPEMPLTLLPPAPYLCQVCGVDHDADLPHDRESLYYQMHFHEQHGRWPTWSDAMRHCTDDVRHIWRAYLAEVAVEVVPEGDAG